MLRGQRREVGDFSFLVLGRGESKCNLSVASRDSKDTSISRKHLTVQLGENGLLVTNHASIPDTTLVDGVPVPPNGVALVKIGSTVTIGLHKSVEFVVDVARPEVDGMTQSARKDAPNMEAQYAAMGLQTSLNFSEPPPEPDANVTMIGNGTKW